jgi:outer membrane receptor for ferrienterochelin and colicin
MNRIRVRAWLLVLLALCLPLGGAHAQGTTTGSIRGTVTSPTGAPVAGAQVTAANLETGLRRSAVTDAGGRYTVALLPPGAYSVRVAAMGYAGNDLGTVRVSVGGVAAGDARLAAQAVLIEGVTVTAGREEAAQGGVASRVTEEQVRNLPVPGRDFTNFVKLSPLVSTGLYGSSGGQFSVGGARASGNNVQVDGADANNSFFGENRGSSRTPFAFSLESIKEFQLITNGFDVEYGSYVGGVVNAVTRGGTNDYHGTGFLYLRNEALTGRDFLGNEPTDFSSKQYGFSLSGPIIRDRLHFFASMDGQQRDQPIFAGTPSAAQLGDSTVNRFQNALSSRYGIQDPGQYYGQFAQTQDNLVLFGRLDWTVSDQHRVTLRQNYSNFLGGNDRVGARESVLSGGPYKTRAYSTVAELNSSLSGTTNNTLRLQFSYEDRPRLANDNGGYLPEFLVNNAEPGRNLSFGGDWVLFRNRLEERKLQLVDNFSWQMGNHRLKVGTNDLLTHTANTFWLLGGGQWQFSSLANFEAGIPSQYSRSVRACPVPLEANAAGENVICPEPDVPFAEFNTLEASLYGQDEWQVSDRLAVIGGVRWTRTAFQDQPGEVPALESAFGITTGEVPSFSGISPRVSFTYDLGDGGLRRSVHGGIGLLTGRAPTVIAGNAFQTERPLLSVVCTGAEIPTINIQELLADPLGNHNPMACRSGGAPTGRPEYTTFDPDFELPETLKANIGYEHAFSGNTRVSADLIYSSTRHNFSVANLNLRGVAFTLAGEEGRPVYVPAANAAYSGGIWRPGSTPPIQLRLANNAFANVYYNTSEAEARAFNAAFTLDQRLGRTLQLSASYAYNRAYDNSSFSCCTSQEGYQSAVTAGDPNFLGDAGDARSGAWGPSEFENRHIVVANLIWHAPLGITASGVARLQSGTPWTPVVAGDINGDGIRFNDRAMVSRSLQFATPADADRFDAILDRFDCLAEQEGRIATRNSCRNPWWKSVDVRLSKEISTFRGQHAELLLDMFNVLNGLNSDWGRLMVVGTNNALLTAQRYDPATGNVVYGVSYDPTANRGQQGFGELQPAGFNPYQFQAQVGVRYRF